MVSFLITFQLVGNLPLKYCVLRKPIAASLDFLKKPTPKPKPELDFFSSSPPHPKNENFFCYLELRGFMGCIWCFLFS